MLLDFQLLGNGNVRNREMPPSQRDLMSLKLLQGHSRAPCFHSILPTDYTLTTVSLGQNGQYWENIIQSDKSHHGTGQSLFLSQISLAKLYGPALVLYVIVQPCSALFQD